MFKFVGSNGRQLALDTSKVAYFEPTPEGRKTEIVFTNGHRKTVDLDYDEVNEWFTPAILYPQLHPVSTTESAKEHQELLSELRQADPDLIKRQQADLHVSKADHELIKRQQEADLLVRQAYPEPLKRRQRRQLGIVGPQDSLFAQILDWVSVVGAFPDAPVWVSANSMAETMGITTERLAEAVDVLFPGVRLVPDSGYSIPHMVSVSGRITRSEPIRDTEDEERFYS